MREMKQHMSSDPAEDAETRPRLRERVRRTPGRISVRLREWRERTVERMAPRDEVDEHGNRDGYSARKKTALVLVTVTAVIAWGIVLYQGIPALID